MSTVARSWSVRLLLRCRNGRGHRIQGSKAVVAFVVTACLLWPAFAQPGTSGSSESANRDKARQVLAATIEALGGTRWLNLRTLRTEGNTAPFFQGRPTGQTQSVTVTTAIPDQQRFDIGRKARVVQIYSGDHAWEITYKGKKALSKEKAADYRRWHDHSLGVVLREWYADPATMMLYDGASAVERHSVDKITLIRTARDAPSNDASATDAVTLAISTETHLPLRLSFEWRDPRFGDKNLSIVEYDNYEHVDGMATAFTITRTVNGETVWQRFLKSVAFNGTYPGDFFNPDAAAARLQ